MDVTKARYLQKIAMQTRRRLVGSTVPAPVPDQSSLYILNNLRKLNEITSDHSYMPQAQLGAISLSS